MNTEQFIRESAARGLSHRATMQALGLGRWKFDLIIGAMGTIEWAKNGTTLGNRLAYEASRGRFTPAQAAALERAHERCSPRRRSASRQSMCRTPVQDDRTHAHAR